MPQTPAVPGLTTEPFVDLRKGDYVVQEVIRQHPKLDDLNEFSVNTVRIMTFLTIEGEVEFLAAILRMSSGLLPLDNFSSGRNCFGSN